MMDLVYDINFGCGFITGVGIISMPLVTIAIYHALKHDKPETGMGSPGAIPASVSFGQANVKLTCKTTPQKNKYFIGQKFILENPIRAGVVVNINEYGFPFAQVFDLRGNIEWKTICGKMPFLIDYIDYDYGADFIKTKEENKFKFILKMNANKFIDDEKIKYLSKMTVENFIYSADEICAGMDNAK